MAEGIIFNVAASIITKLGSRALRDLGLIWGVDDELQKLKDTVSAIEAVLLDAEDQQSKSHAVKNWISKLKDAFYDVEDLIDEFSYEDMRRQIMTKDKRNTKQVRVFFSKSNQIVFGLKIGHEVKAIRKKLDAIASDRAQFHFSERLRDTRDDEVRERRHTHSFVREEEVIGRNDDKKAIIDLLIDTNMEEDISVIAIVGIGGLGKTTLAQSVYNDEKTGEHFELKLWVCISEVFDVKIIVENILESATMKKPEPLEMDSLQTNLRREIDGKKYLLIMDDVWNDNHEKWVDLKRLLTGGAKGSKIVITTRHEQVARTSDAAILYSLKGLSEDNSWLLFRQMAVKRGEEFGNPNLIEIGKEIVAKLKGVPLVIRIIGRLLYFKKSEVDWLSFKDNELNTVMLQENEIQSMLMLSYKHLPSNLKQCFAYCALFPKDHEIPKDDVIKQWMAQGLLVQPCSMKKPVEDVGHDYFMELSWRSFFQDVRQNERGDIIYCKMHDLMHDLACSVVENEYVLANVDAWRIDRRTRHVSLNLKFNEKWELPELFEAKNLRTLLLHPQHHPYGGRKRISEYYKFFLNKIFSSFLQLRSLNLNSAFFRKLPESISKLKHLRYLNLTSNHLFLLPNSITQLYHLETLILRYCLNLEELPRDTQNWINLRHLDLLECRRLTCMPKGLGGLIGLQTLNAFVLGVDDDGGLSELKGLNNLRGSLTIRGLKFCRAVDLNANYLKLKSNLQELELYWPWNFRNPLKDKPCIHAFDDHERVLECLQPHPSVQKLRIVGYQGVRLSDWLSFNSLVHLVSITLSSCEKLHCLPQFDQFPFLKNLILQNLHCIEYIDINVSLSSSTFFPSLEKLSISNMPKLKGWWKDDTTAEIVQKGLLLPVFPCLGRLEIVDCCQLTSIPWHPPLWYLKIGGIGMQLLDMVMKATKNFLAIASPSTLTELHSLRLIRIKDLEFLSGDLFCNLRSLALLHIEDCNNLQMSSIRVEEHLIGEDDTDILWQQLRNLLQLYLKGIPKLEYLPKGLQYVTTLQSLHIQDCPNLMTLPEWLGNLTSLRVLCIGNCLKLTSLSEGMRHLASLRDLRIHNCSNLNSLPEGIRHLNSLSHLEIYGCSSLTCLPEGICHLNSLSHLEIYGCSSLTSLPEGICNLHSLHSLSIRSCLNLTCLPEGMRHLHCLQSLRIVNCPKVLMRCKKGTGEDWHKIAHIPWLDLS